MTLSIGDWAKIISGVAAVVTLVIAAISIAVNSAVSARNQRSAVILHCSLRYDALYDVRARIDELPVPNPRPPISEASPHTKAFFNRYFGLESDQIDFWLAGYVDPETLSSWLVSLVESLHEKSVGGYDFEEGWKHISDLHRVVNPTLSAFIKKSIEEKAIVRSKSDKDDEIYCRIVDFMERTERRQRKIRRRLRKLFSASFSARELTSTLPPNLKNRVKQLRRQSQRA